MLVYPGMLQLFGGHANPGEEPAAAAKRELLRKTNLSAGDLEQLTYTGLEHYIGQGEEGEDILRDASIFTLDLPSAENVETSTNENSRVVIIPRTLESLGQYQGEMTPFAYMVLEKALQSERNG